MSKMIGLFLLIVAVHADEEFFLGKFKALSEGRENTAELAKAYGGTEDFSDQAEVEFSKQGDEYHHKFGVPSQNYHQDLPFKFGEERQTTFNGTSYKYKYEKDGEKKLKATYILIGEGDKTTIQHYTFHDGGFEKISRIPHKNIVAKIIYKKQA